MAPSTLILVEDSLNDSEDVRAAWSRVVQSGRALAPFELRPPEAMLGEVAGAAAGPGEAPDPLAGRDWAGDEVVLLDCWDRDAADDREGPFRSTFVVLDLLDAFRRRADAGGVVPRIVAFSRAMHDPLVRATLSEFLHRQQVAPVDRSGVKHGWRVDLDAPADGVLWAMFDRTTLMARLHAVVLGDPRGALGPPPPDDPIWSECLAGSCLASFQIALRDQYPTVWDERVLGGPGVGALHDSTRTGIIRLGLRYLEPNPDRDRLGYEGLVNLARDIARPH